MLESSRYGEVIQLIMGREMSGQVLYRVAAYLVDGLMIDTGCSHTAEELLDFARREKIERVYLTHYHEDHIGACALLQKELEIDIYANPITISLIHTPHQLYPYQELVWGYPEAADVEPIKDGRITTKKYRFEVMDTPGHSKDHTALIEPELGWCFTGDLFVSEKLKVLRPEEDIALIMNSVKKLLDYFSGFNRDFILFTSIGRVIPEGRQSLKNYLDYLYAIGEKARQLSVIDGMEVEEIVGQIFGGESNMAELTNGQFASRNLVKSLLQTQP